MNFSRPNVSRMRSSSFSSRRLAWEGEVFSVLSKDVDEGPLPVGLGLEVSDMERRLRENESLDERDDVLRCLWSWFSGSKEMVRKVKGKKKRNEKNRATNGFLSAEVSAR